MRHSLILLVALTAATVGCRKQELHARQEEQRTPQTAAEPQERPLTSLAPQPAGPQPQQPPAEPPSESPAEEPREVPAEHRVEAPSEIPAGHKAYTVRKGDTFWSIARDVYGDGKLWTRIQQANPGVDPNRLRVGQIIKIPVE